MIFPIKVKCGTIEIFLEKLNRASGLVWPVPVKAAQTAHDLKWLDIPRSKHSLKVPGAGKQPNTLLQDSITFPTFFAAWMRREVVSDKVPIFHLQDVTVVSVCRLIPQSSQEWRIYLLAGFWLNSFLSLTLISRRYDRSNINIDDRGCSSSPGLFLSESL